MSERFVRLGRKSDFKIRLPDNLQPFSCLVGNTLSIFRMILSAHYTEAAIMASVSELP
jgi:hypothetical protein